MTQRSGNIPKVVLWTMPRAVATAFERSIRALGDIKVYHEVYGMAAYFGEERYFPHFLDRPVQPGCKFNDIKQMLENEDKGCRGIFLKDLAYRIADTGRYDALPEGFQHTFLIRPPMKSVPSFYKNFAKAYGPEKRPISSEVGFREMWELYQYIRDHKGQTPLVIDSDDLLSDPATIMKKYCEAVGFEFRESMLQWEPGLVDGWHWEEEWYGTVSSSSCFKRPIDVRSSDTEKDESSLPVFIRKAIQDAEPYHEKLYNLRLKP
ncbi:uncharacterized protein [Ptychodera flava]|uniref:uncharacterized protein n=1 Tax=Ptychodera flava TaxID=63121 RepID=UPI00396A45BD